MHADWSRESPRGPAGGERGGPGRLRAQHVGPATSCSAPTGRSCAAARRPSFLLPGSDTPHPAETSAELAELLPNVEVLADWRGPDHLEAQQRRVVGFLKAHTPAAG